MDKGFGVPIHCPACGTEFEILPVPNRVSIDPALAGDTSVILVEFESFTIEHNCERSKHA